MAILIASAAAFGILSIYFLGRTIHCTRRGRLIRAVGATLSLLTSLAVAAVAVLLLFSYYSYERLTAEQVISTIEFRRIAPDTYRARVMVRNEVDQLFELNGDEWQMDARIVSWTPPATILGLEPIYRLERLSGRYADIERERTEPRTVHALTETEIIDVWTVAQRFPVLLPGVDAHYGTATFVPMADGARFEVSLTRDAIIARPVNRKARDAVGNWQPSAQ
jgi:hypothetical protein